MRELPILSFAPFREYPTRQERQQYEDSRDVCQNCVSGGCCSSEDPVYLTSFDVFRLAAFFDMSPATFMLSFTQERFADPESDGLRRQLIDDPDCSIITYLRRRENSPTSPCIFLKYIRDPDGLIRRICSVHEGRPLACREFYSHHCRMRVTGELASLQAEGFEKLRDGEITEELIDSELTKFRKHDPQTATLSTNIGYFFWVEMKRALNMDQANVEGANSYKASDYQDAIDVKLNRVLSAKHVRFEEKYGPTPRDEQLLPYTAGLGFAGSEECERIMLILRTAPSSGLYSLGNYPFYAGGRMAFRHAKYPSKFSIIPDTEIAHFLNNLPHVLLFPQHDVAQVRTVTLRDVYSAILKAYNHLIRFGSYIATIEDVLEGYESGFLESEFLLMLAGFESSLNPYIASNPSFQPLTEHMAKRVIDCLEMKIAAARSPEDVFDSFRFLSRIRTIAPSLSGSLQDRLKVATMTVDANLKKELLELYVVSENPIARRYEAGKHLRVKRAWCEWFEQVLDMRYAAMAGFPEINLAAFYRKSVSELVKIPFHESYVLDLYDMACNLACSMSFYDSIPCRRVGYEDVAEDLLAYAIRLFNWVQGSGALTYDCEIDAGFLSPVYKGLGLSYNGDASFGLIVRRLLDSQLPDGSWQTDPVMANGPATQSEYLCTMYRATWACVDALRPLRNDLSNGENASLGLV